MRAVGVVVTPTLSRNAYVTDGGGRTGTPSASNRLIGVPWKGNAGALVLSRSDGAGLGERPDGGVVPADARRERADIDE